jgi:hypothetical protein
MDEELPHPFDQLSHNDQLEYRKLKESFALPRWQTPRNGAAETFQRMLTTVRQFVMKGDEEDAKRAMVAGIMWTDVGVVLNTRDFSKMTGRSKSSINGGFQSMGYGTLPIGHGIPTELMKAFPTGHCKFSTLRHWTVRGLIANSAREEQGQEEPDEQEQEQEQKQEQEHVPLTDVVRDLLHELKRPIAQSAFPCEGAIPDELDFDFSDGNGTASFW